MPGVGQLTQCQDRFIVYLALETFGWVQYAKDEREFVSQRRQSSDLALYVARAPFVNPATAPAGTWSYYEAMEHWLESGQYSLAAGSVVPDTIVSQYNGYIWDLALRNNGYSVTNPAPVGTPAYQNALAFYVGRAFGPSYQWSWRDAQLQQDLYRSSIDRKNTAARRAVSDLSLILANHVLSAVDAFVGLRLEALQLSTGSLHVSIVPGW